MAGDVKSKNLKTVSDIEADNVTRIRDHTGMTLEELANAPTVYREGLLDGKTAVISGGGSGMGRAMAVLFARLGANVVICGRREEKLIEVKDGVCRHNGTLAGSILTIARAVRNMRDFVGLPLEEAIQMGTLNTAQLMGISERKGCLKSGADADLVILDQQLTVRQVYVRGLPVE